MHKSLIFTTFLSTSLFFAACKKEAVTTSDTQAPVTTVDTSKTDVVLSDTLQKADTTKIVTNALPASTKPNTAAPEKKEIKKKQVVDITKIDAKPPVISQTAKPTMVFTETTHKFGLIKQGDVVKHKFQFKNTGNAPLQITNASATCGCTQPSFPFMPIEPNQTGEIEITFDSKGKFGEQKPKVTVQTNTAQGTYHLFLEGNVDAELVPATPKEGTKPEGGH